MPTLPPVARAARVAISGTISTTDWSCILHFLFDTTPSSTNMQELATKSLTHWNFYLTPNFSNGYKTTTCITEDLSATPALPGAASSSVTGGDSTGLIGAQTCMLVKHTIARRYRGGHPRTYLPSPGADKLTDDGHWTSSIVTSSQTNWDGFIGAVISDTYTGTTVDSYINISYHSGGAPRVTPVTDLITGSVVENVIATQRRRVGR